MRGAIASFCWIYLARSIRDPHTRRDLYMRWIDMGNDIRTLIHGCGTIEMMNFMEAVGEDLRNIHHDDFYSAAG